MTNLLNPWQGVIKLLSLVAGFIQAGISGIRKKFTKDDFLPVVYVRLGDLKVDKKYQRLVNLNFIKKAKKFRPELVKPLTVFKRPNGDLFIVDGQHTACLAGVYVEDAENFELPCQIQVHPADFTPEQCEEKEAEYFKRFNKIHKSSKVLLNIAFNDHKNDIPKGDMTPPPQCMPDQYKLRSDLYVNAYRDYYKGEKEYFAKWEKGRQQPEWWIQ